MPFAGRKLDSSRSLPIIPCRHLCTYVNPRGHRLGILAALKQMLVGHSLADFTGCFGRH